MAGKLAFPAIRLSTMWKWRETLYARTVFGLVFVAAVLLAWAMGQPLTH